MHDMDKEEMSKSIDRMMNAKKNSTKVFLSIQEILWIKKENVARKIVFIAIELLASFLIAFSPEVVSITKNVFEITNTIILALMAIVFTGYVFFQALLSDSLLLLLLKNKKKNGESKLEESNNYYAQIMMIFFTCIFLNMLTIIFSSIVPKNWGITSSSQANSYICVVILLLITHINGEAIWETKSFIFNVFQLFNAHAATRFMEIIKDEKKEE